MLSCGGERYGLICHSKYTNPTATADTTTKCMNSLLTIDCCNASDAGTQRLIYGYREIDFQTTYFKILASDMWMPAMKPRDRRGDRPGYKSKRHICLRANSSMTDIDAAVD